MAVDTERTGQPGGPVSALDAYLGAFLPPGDASEAAAEALDEAGYWGDRERDDVLRCARRSLTARTLPPPHEEAVVLVTEGGLEPGQAAGMVGIPEDEVRRVLDERRATEEPAETPSDTAERARVRRQLLAIQAAIALLLIIAGLAIGVLIGLRVG